METGDSRTDRRSISRYLHGTEPHEQLRLSALNDLLNEASLREIDFQGGEKILDVGCGLAQLSRALARAAGSGTPVVGIERSPEQLVEAARLARAAGEETLIDLRQGDALDLPLKDAEWGTFDVAHTRFLLEHVPDPLRVVRGMVRAVRPGGRVILEDDNHEVLRLWPEPPGFGPLWKAYLRSYDRLGNDPYIGHRLIALLFAAGAAPKRNTWIFFGSCAGNPTWEPCVDNLVGILQGARETCIAAGLIERTSFEEGLTALQAWKRRPDAALWFAISFAEGVRAHERAVPSGSAAY
jgi:SAM-dependent methyltransferase